MGQKNSEKRSFLKKLTDPYRLIIIDEDTFEHKVDFSLSRLNVFLITGALALLLVGLTIVLIASTSLREYIPGYPSVDFKRKIYVMNRQLDSLREEVELRNQYLDRLRLILTGELQADKLQSSDIIPTEKTQVSADSLALEPSAEDLALRKEVEEKEKFTTPPSLSSQTTGFLPPLRGHISQEFNVRRHHYGIDIVVKKKTPVKAIAPGTVIFSAWTPDNGNVIIIQHPGKWLSVYKHNHKLLKRQGDQVEAGEVIAISGDTGTNTTGPHLHFELWKNGKAVNPEAYMDFQPDY